MCVCVYVCMYVCVYVYMYVCVYVCMCLCVYVCMYTNIWEEGADESLDGHLVDECVSRRVNVWICVYVYLDDLSCAYTSTFTRVNVFIYMLFEIGALSISSTGIYLYVLMYLNVCICTCIYLRVFVDTMVFIEISTLLIMSMEVGYVHLYAFIYLYMCIYIHIYLCMCVCIHTYISMYMCIYKGFHRDWLFCHFVNGGGV